jgi:diguanylate cyclase (GGDEF)-like protein
VITNLAYPLGYLLLIAFIGGSLVLSGTRRSGPLALVGVGLLIWAAVDVLYLVQLATGTYEGGLIDTAWPLATLFIAGGAFFSLGSRPERVYHSSFVFPAIFTLLATALLVVPGAHEHGASSIGTWLAGATILTVVVRLAVSYRENTRLVSALHQDALTDVLTGLGNRRSLLVALEDVVRGVNGTSADGLLVVFDLDGFKDYNDTFGHSAGDALLRRAATSLEAAVGPDGCAYRMGGDEFCLLTHLGARSASSIMAAGREALTVEGDGFKIGASAGMVVVPREATSAEQALRRADERMYEEKAVRPGRADDYARTLLRRLVHNVEPKLHGHQSEVARLAQLVAHELAPDSESIDVIVRCAEFHDIGKIAIPNEVLTTAGRLDPVEWELMKKHTLIGERLLGVSPAMAPVGQAIRSSHERWDGGGYPDGLAGAAIPLSARIVFVCDAFDAMRSKRPYSAAMSVNEAVEELRRHAGTQFDPEVVNALCRIVLAEELASAPSILPPFSPAPA